MYFIFFYCWMAFHCIYHISLKYHSLFSHSSADKHFLFQFWAIMYKLLCRQMFSFLLGIYLGVNCWLIWQLIFNHLRNCQAAFRSGHNILHSHQKCTRICISPNPQQHLLLSAFWLLPSLWVWSGTTLWFWFIFP